MSIQPKTKRSDLVDQINKLIMPGKFVDPASPEVMEINRGIEELFAVDRDSALWIRALLLHMMGDLDGALATIEQCDARDPLSRLVLLSNYCRCGVAQKFYAENCGPDTGLFSAGVLYGRVIGAFHKLAEFSHRAEKMCLSNLEGVGLKEIYMVDELLTEMGISDAVTGDLMETAGAVLEEHGLMFLGNGPEIDVFDVPGELRGVHLTYRVSTSTAEAVAIYMDFIQRLFETDRTMPRGINISFEGVDA